MTNETNELFEFDIHGVLKFHPLSKCEDGLGQTKKKFRYHFVPIAIVIE